MSLEFDSSTFYGIQYYQGADVGIYKQGYTYIGGILTAKNAGSQKSKEEEKDHYAKFQTRHKFRFYLPFSGLIPPLSEQAGN